MVVGILQFELLIRGAESLKDKRRVVRSVKDRLHREHLVSVAEVDRQDEMRAAVMGLALVGTDGRHVAQTFDRICAKLHETLVDAELGATSRRLIHGYPESVPGREEDADASDSGSAIAAEMLVRGGEAIEQCQAMDVEARVDRGGMGVEPNA
jgi:uncharacterized protein YlxP (DUF503 family)